MRRFALALLVSAIAAPAIAQEGSWPGGDLLRLSQLDYAPIPYFAAPPPQGTPEQLPATSATSPTDLKTEELILAPGWQLWSPAIWKPWEGSVELGLSGTDGNTETFNVRFGMTAKHKTDYLVQTLQITSIQKSADGATTANTALIEGRQEWPMPQSRWNYYLHGLIEYDQFKAFDYRLSADTGPGYEFIQTEATTLVGRIGASVSQEVGGNAGNTKPELAISSEFKHKFNPTHSIMIKYDYFPNVTDFGDFRLNTQASWEIVLSHSWGLSLKLSMIDRYDSTPQGRRPNDLDYSTLVLWKF